jgi:hypothetical protein
MKNIYRLYIDESGTHGYGDDMNVVKNRHLALLGVFFTKEHNESLITPRIEEIRKLFVTDVDLPPSLHLTEIRNKQGAFASLASDEVRKAFDEKYMNLLKDGDFTICCVVLDKRAHKERYGLSASHPYHYCLSVLLERYVRFLNERGATGDVIAECRGKKEDRSLRSEFEHYYQVGTEYLPASSIQRALSSKEIKLRRKEARIAGLELADLLAMPYLYHVLHQFGAIDAVNDNFSKQVVAATQSKVRAGGAGNSVVGYGIKLIK